MMPFSDYVPHFSTVAIRWVDSIETAGSAGIKWRGGLPAGK